MHSVGILGGTFDPIHFGHLRFAEEVADALGLDEVRFIPCARPPHRGEPHGTRDHRVAMVKLAIASNPSFQIDLREFDREGPSYMVDTLSSLRSEFGAGTSLYLLLGADAFIGLPTWHRWRELFDLAHLVVAHRPGSDLRQSLPPALQSEWLARQVEASPIRPFGNIFSCDITALDISASAIRRSVAEGRSVRYLLPDAVNDYLQSHSIYHKETHGT